eukprot:gb/GFBE01016573.1/.p1 GENE.gb/GFBE01016573.1/~~gb/GFBE01016573.1/.p1  ORF type:complete len:179 (+),score=33.65 gb/GFBE01016573.1/:1-537(+)
MTSCLAMLNSSHRHGIRSCVRQAATAPVPAAASQLRALLDGKRAGLVSDLLPAKSAVTQEAPRGPRLRWGRGPLGSAARAAAAEQEAAEAAAERHIQRSIGRSPIGLYPVYDCPRQVAGVFTGTKVLQPSSLRYALAEGTRVPRSAAGDGRARLAGVSDGTEVEEIEEVEFIEGEEEE